MPEVSTSPGGVQSCDPVPFSREGNVERKYTLDLEYGVWRWGGGIFLKVNILEYLYLWRSKMQFEDPRIHWMEVAGGRGVSKYRRGLNR